MLKMLSAPALWSTVIALSVGLAGCKASIQVGESAPKKKKQKKEEPPPPAPAPAPAPKPKPKLRFSGFKKVGNEIQLPSPVPYKTGSAELDGDAGAFEILGIVKDYLDKNPDVTMLRIEGHTDSDGDDAMNEQLSKDRAMSATRWLTANGINCKRLVAVGFGETRPIAPNDTPENKQKNRRVSFFDAAVKGQPVKNEKGQPIPVDNNGKSAGDPCK
jgi:OOP family OmpA-OmpF porin